MLQDNLELSALTLDELLSNNYKALPESETDAELATRRLEKWCRLSADGDWKIFEKRLQRDNLTLRSVRLRLGGVRRREGSPTPIWVASSLQALSELKGQQTDGANLNGSNLSTRSAPFESLINPVVVSAETALRERLGTLVDGHITTKAWLDTIDHLTQRLANLCELPFYQSLINWRNDLISQIHVLGEMPVQESLKATDLSEFAAYMRAFGFDALFKQNPILLRLIATIKEQWVESYAEFFLRLANDRKLLRLVNPQVTRISEVSSIEWGVSDPHNRGRSVMIIVFDSSHRLVYKPKDLEPDTIVCAFAEIFKNQGLKNDFMLPKVLVRDGYGWTEFIKTNPCQSLSEVREFYRNMGGWLGFFYLLSTSDVHMENIIARGHTPIPVDCETILQGLSWKPKAIRPETEAIWNIHAFLDASVQTVGILPTYIRTEGEDLVSVGALESSKYSVKRIRWTCINTVMMQPQEEVEQIEISSNLPLFNEMRISVNDYRCEFIDGFKSLMSFALENKSVIEKFFSKRTLSDFKVRRVFRPTRFYYMLIKRLLDHRNMSDSVEWSMQAEFIARLYDWGDDAEETWKIFIEERADLLEINIPIFYLRSSSNVIGKIGRDVTKLHIDIGIEVCINRINNLSPKVIDDQVTLIRSALQLPATSTEENVGVTLDFSDALHFKMVEMRERNIAWATAVEVEAHVRAKAFHTVESIAWLGLDYIDHQVATQIGPMGHDLYNGSTGIAVFYAALAATQIVPDSRLQALRSVAATRYLLSSPNAGRLVRSIGLGGGVGIGSVVYGLAVVAQLLGEEQVLEAAVAGARLVSDEAIELDEHFDVIRGVAGTCLALLKLYSLTKEDWILARAEKCAAHLLAHRPTSNPWGIWSSTIFKHQPLTGISHGSSGYALAFSRLYKVTQDDRFKRTAQDCIAFENSWFDEERNNWPDLRPNQISGAFNWPRQWCYGAVGIGYARLAMKDDGCFPPDELERDIRRAIVSTRNAWPYSNDTLCCGTAGHIDFLVEAAQVFPDAGLLALSKQRIDAIHRRWKRTGDMHWDRGSKEFNIGLFRGISGVGFAAVRSENPSLPRILVWE